MPDGADRDYASEAIRFARAEFGVDLAPDDPLVIGYALQVRAQETAAMTLDIALKEHRDLAYQMRDALKTLAKDAADEAAVEGDQRNTTQKLVTTLERVTRKFEAAGLQFQRLAEHRDSVVLAARDLGHEMRAFSGEMLRIREVIETTHGYSHLVPIAMLLGAATFVVGIAAGLALMPLISNLLH